MDLEEGLAFAAQGRALLFLGAGFSLGATSILGQDFVLGSGLAARLASEVGISETLALEDISDIYHDTFGARQLLDTLRGVFTAKTVTDSQKIIAGIPWRQVYTTNYDDVYERACLEVGKKVVPHNTLDSISAANRSGITCIHLNGFIQRATEGSLSEELKLSGTSYSAGSAMNDEWAERFRFDLHSAQAIFFLGYSLADLELKRLLLEAELAEKSFFILKKEPSIADAHRAGKFGLLVAEGVEAFAQQYSNFISHYELSPDIEPISFCLKPYQPPTPSEEIQDRQILELLLSGRLRQDLIASSFLGSTVYCGIRSSVEHLISSFRPGKGVIFFTGALGNGKSVSMAEARYGLFTKGYEVYELVNRSDSLKEELSNALRKPKHKIIFIDNYVQWLDILPVFRGFIGPELTLVMSARTASHDALEHRVSDSLRWTESVSFDLDVLRQEELQWISNFLDTYGLWDDRAGDSPERKLKFLRDKCGANWSSILLAIFEAPQIKEKLQLVFESLKGGFDYRQALFKFLILTVLGYHPDSPTLITLCGDELLSTSFRSDPAVSELVEFGKDTVSMRSSVVAQFLLQKIVDPNRTVAALISLIKEVDQLADGSTYYWEMFKNLVRFSAYNLFFAEESRGRSAMRVYEAIKDLSHCTVNPLFWLQYAIAALVAKDYERSGRYFGTSYAHAERLDRYDAFQIDNHYARYLLERSIGLGTSEPIEVFRKVRSLLKPQFHQEWRHYPYRVAIGYYDFAGRFLDDLSSAELAEVVQASTEILDRIATLPEERKQHRAVIDCASAQRRVLRLSENP